MSRISQDDIPAPHAEILELEEMRRTPSRDGARQAVQDAVERIRNRAEKFDDMSYARIGLILFRYA